MPETDAETDAETGADTDAVADADTAARQHLQRLLDGQPSHVVDTVGFLSRLLGATASRPHPRTFLESHLGAEYESVTVRPSLLSTDSVAAVVGSLMRDHPHVIGPGDEERNRGWRRLRIDEDTISVPENTAAYFAPGVLAEVPIVVRIYEGENYDARRDLTVHAPEGHGEAAAQVLDGIRDRACGADSLARGRILRPAMVNGNLVFEVMADLEGCAREDLVLDAGVWREIDLNVAALTTHRDAMSALGLGTRRGVLLAGPPGTGKSALARQIASELTGTFTTVIVDAAAAEQALEDIYDEARHLGPMLIILEDLDLYASERANSRRANTLAHLLSALDGTLPGDNVLTIATTNDPESLDKAAIRSARFDSLIEIGYPVRADAERILRRYLDAIPGNELIDVAIVVAALPEEVSGADLREVVRRAVLREGVTLTTQGLLGAVHEGRWRITQAVGNYL